MSITKKINDLDARYSQCCDEYIKLFCEKQEIDYENFEWLHTNETATFNDEYFFSIEEIIYDINTEQPKHNILEWQDYIVKHTLDNNKLPTINYRSYCIGARYEIFKKP